MQSLLMGIKSNAYPEDSLFHTIDMPPRASMTLMVHHPDDNAQAHALKAGLLPFLRWKLRKHYKLTMDPCSEEENKFFQPLLYDFFTVAVVLRSIRFDWDEVTQEVVCFDADELEANLEADPKYKKLKAVALDMTTVQQTLHPQQSQMRRPTAKGALKKAEGYRTNTTDSISTVHPDAPATNSNLVSTTRQATRRRSQSPSDRSQVSESTIQSTRSNTSRRSTTSSVSLSTLTTLTQQLATLASSIAILNDRVQAIEPRHENADPDMASEAQHDNQTLAHPPDQEGGPPQ
jgi:hypothetical protein